MNRLQSTGRSQQRVDALAKAQGEHVFPSDNTMPGMLWVRILRAMHAHARIVSIDTRRACALDGVACVLTAADIPGQNRFGLAVADQPVLADERVRFEGEPLAIVAAETDAAARRACAAIDVVYEAMEPVCDPTTAETGPPLHENGNLCAALRLGHHDVESVLAQSEEIIELAYTTNRQEHAFLETEAGASWLDADGILTLSVGGQNPFHDRKQVAAALGLETGRVRVLNPMMGGAFGGKEDCNVQIPLALVTHLTGRPARMMFDRRESLRAGVKRHAFDVRYRVGASRRGRLGAIKVDLLVDAGAYMTLSPAVITQAAEHATGPYLSEAADIQAKAVFTNNGNASAFRGFGNPQVAIGIEQVMDELGRRVGLTPFEVRRINLLKKGQTAGPGHVMRADTVLPRLLDAAERGATWQGRDAFRAAGAAWKRRGVGVSAIWQGYGLGAGIEGGAEVRLSITRSGSFRLAVGTPDLGAGNITAFLQLAADELHTTVEHFDYATGDSAGPDSGSSHASRTVYVVGNAVVIAARTLRERIIETVSRARGGARAELGRRFVRVSGEELSLIDAFGLMAEPEAVATFKPVEAEAIGLGIPHAGYGYWVQVMGVEVDLLTGEVAVLDVENYLDTGRTINPAGVVGQCEGAFAQGLGYALYENAVYDGGVLRNPTLSNYVIPSVKDMPPRLVTTIFETPDDTNPLGVRGIAEIGLTPVAASVANAVFDAIGARFASFPILPEMVLAAIAGRQEAPLG